ncbi:hypothetical protein AAFG07_11275 [Bradyrhizobium sp. B097]|uniref:hypothetical protein n=1 Tax=Bradyrhizobium sp. B097 TaxID=3140244 RepID=UPI0031832A8B
MTANGTILIATKPSGGVPAAGRIYYSSVSAPSTISSIDTTIKSGYSTCLADVAYFLEEEDGNGIANRRSQVAVVDCSGTPSVTLVDLATQEATIVCIAQGGPPAKIWNSGSHIFVL